MTFNNEFINDCLSSSSCKHQILYVLECVTVTDKNGISPPKFSVVKDLLTKDPTTILPVNLAPYRRSMVSLSGWSNLHDFMYVKKKDTDELGWQYRSSWPTSLDELGIDEPWASSFTAGKHFVRRRLWITTNVDENDLMRAKKILSTSLRAHDDGAVLSVGKLPRQEKGLLGAAWKERVVVLKHKELEFLDVKSNKKVSSISLIGIEPVICGSPSKDVQYGLMIKQSDGTTAFINTLDAEKRNMWEYLLNYQIALLSDNLNFACFDFGGPDININFTKKIVYSGFLQKQGHQVKNWKVRFAKLTAFDLNYYDGAELKGFIDVLGSTLEDGKEGSCEFSIKDKSGKILLMKADSEDKAERWKREIQRCTSGNFIKEEEKQRAAKEDEEEREYLAKEEEKERQSIRKKTAMVVNPLANIVSRNKSPVNDKTLVTSEITEDNDESNIEATGRISIGNGMKEAFCQNYSSDDDEIIDILPEITEITDAVSPKANDVQADIVEPSILEEASSIEKVTVQSSVPIIEIEKSESKEMTPAEKAIFAKAAVSIPATVSADIFFKKSKFLREDTEDVIPQMSFSQSLSLPKPAAASKSRDSFYRDPDPELPVEVEVVAPPVAPERRQSVIKPDKPLPSNLEEAPQRRQSVLKADKPLPVAVEESAARRQSVFKVEKPLPTADDNFAQRRQSVLKAEKPLPSEAESMEASSRRQSVLKTEKPLPAEAELNEASPRRQSVLKAEKPVPVERSADESIAVKPEKRLSVVKPEKRVSMAVFNSEANVADNDKINETSEKAEIQSKEMILDLIEKNRNLAEMLKTQITAPVTKPKPEKRPSMADIVVDALNKDGKSLPQKPERRGSVAKPQKDVPMSNANDRGPSPVLVTTIPFSSIDSSTISENIENKLRSSISIIRQRKSITSTYALVEADVQEASIHEANIHEANIQEANIQEANIQEANIQEASIQEASMQEASIQEARIQEASIQEARIQETSIQEANMQEASIQKPEKVTFGTTAPPLVPRKSLSKLFGAIEEVSEHPSDNEAAILPESSMIDSTSDPYSEVERTIVRRKSSKYDKINVSVPANDGEVELLKQMFELNMSKLESQMSSKLSNLESQLLYEREANDALKTQVETLIGKTISQEQFNKFATDYQDSLKTNASENLTSYLDDFKNDIKNNLEKKVDKIINGLELKELGPPVKSPPPSQGVSKVSLIPVRQAPQPKASLDELGPPQPSARLETRRTISNFVDAWTVSNDEVTPSSDDTTAPDNEDNHEEITKRNVSELFKGAAKGIIEARRASLPPEQSDTGPKKRMSMAHIAELAKPKSVVPKNPIALRGAKAEVQPAASKKSSSVTPVEPNQPKKASMAYISELAKPRSVVPKNPVARRSSTTNTEAETDAQKSSNPNIAKLRAKVASRASTVYLQELAKPKEVPKSLDTEVKADVKTIIEEFNRRNSGNFI